ncbi:MAG: bifunctional 5,10-methylenetetrahydrofolate dehydrogenase/5,10-methenyltetrahydrofolate cyclohydrolase [Defluviitaleaceae bacterium]|nr:bifunctional 5,10-methylenetetrahydrofolate dehydrogenase/5,10-methenyltetrahydrofolate cyclohydrolase [Defluviitaleaceae bacterium]
MAIIMDGKALAGQLKAKVKAKIEQSGLKPGLAVVVVGDNPASLVYVKNKKRDCAECGIHSEEFALAADVGEDKLLALVEELNNRADIHGILVQFPLPAGYSEDKVIQAICPNKDVDAFHALNTGKIMSGNYTFLPCTPAGVMMLLDNYGIDPAGKHCVVVGRSNTVGKPQAMLLLHRDATVTICHSRTQDLGAMTRQADILVSAVGRVGLITADMVKPGAVVIDVAINRGEDGKLRGDVDFAAVEPIASHITPVPGGVGPMTRAVLMENTLRAAMGGQYGI